SPTTRTPLRGLLDHLERRQLSDQLLRLNTHRDERANQVDDVAWVLLLAQPRVRIVDDARLRIGRHLVPVDHPLERAAPADLVFALDLGDAGDREVLVVTDAGVVLARD